MTPAKPQSGPLVHQMLWHASDRTLTGIAGFGPVASSLPEDELEQWWMALRAKLNAAPPDLRGTNSTALSPTYPDYQPSEYVHSGARHAAAPCDDFSYLLLRVGDREHAVVVRKRPVADDLGRAGSSRAHVLIGPPPRDGVSAGISPDVALGLTACDWEGWLSAGHASTGTGTDTQMPTAPDVDPSISGPDAIISSRLRPLALQEVRVKGRAAYDRVRGEPHDRGWPQAIFTDLLLRVLSAPELPSRLAPAGPNTLSLLCVLYEVLGDVVEGLWTFATREPPGQREAAWLVFTTGGPVPQPSPTARDEWLAGFAEALARLYGDEGMHGIERYLGVGKQIRTGADAVGWAHACSTRPGVLRDDVALLRHAMAGNLTGAERSYLHGQNTEPEVQAIVAGLTADQLASLLDKWSPTVTKANPAAAEAYFVATLVLRTALARAGGPAGSNALLNALNALARRMRDPVQELLLGGFAQDVARLAKLDGRRDEPDWKAWHELALQAASFDAVLERATETAFSLMPAHALLAYISSVVVNRAGRQYQAARSAWKAIVRRQQGSGGAPALVRHVLLKHGLLKHLHTFADVLSTPNLQSDERDQVRVRLLAYREMLRNQAIGGVLLRRNAALLRKLLDDSPGWDDALLLAIYECQRENHRLPRKVRGRLREDLARCYLDFVLNPRNRG